MSPPPPPGGSPRSTEAVASWTAAHQDDLIAFRRHLHAHPEPSGREHATTDLVVERLTAAGHRPSVLDSGTGVVCDVGSPDVAPEIALRADIDGLAMLDETSVPYRSQNHGVAHACGHDVHTAVVLGAGLAMADHLRDAGRALRLVFEPAEEQLPGGAVEVIDAGWLEGVRAVYGLHCDPRLDVGTVGTRVGPITSAADRVAVALHGPGGHTARPHLTVDLVAVAARFALDLPELLVQLAPGEILLVWGSLRTGDAANVIPTTAHLEGTLRTPEHGVWEQAGALLAEAASRLLGPSGVELEIDHRWGVPPVVNHRRETDILERAVRRTLGEGARVDTPRSAGADSFAWYLASTGGTYARLGTHDPAVEVRHDLHVGDFDVDERAIAVGVRVLAATVAAELDLP